MVSANPSLPLGHWLPIYVSSWTNHCLHYPRRPLVDGAMPEYGESDAKMNLSTESNYS